MNTKALTSAAIAGLLRPMLQDVNVVSAPRSSPRSAASWSRR